MYKLKVVSYLTIVITFVLFVVALFTKGLTHDILLEAGVFLVSVKLILATNQILLHTTVINEKLDKFDKEN